VLELPDKLKQRGQGERVLCKKEGEERSAESEEEQYGGEYENGRKWEIPFSTKKAESRRTEAKNLREMGASEKETWSRRERLRTLRERKKTGGE